MPDGDDDTCAGARLRKGSATMYTVPLPTGISSQGARAVSVNEFHAHVLGVAASAYTTITYALGYDHTAFIVASALVGYAVFGAPALQSLPHDVAEYETTIALKTVKWEPWHFIGAFGVGLAVLVGALGFGL